MKENEQQKLQKSLDCLFGSTEMMKNHTVNMTWIMSSYQLPVASN